MFKQTLNNIHKTFLIIKVENSWAAYFFVETVVIYFRILWWIESLKEVHPEVEIFCNTIHVFTVTIAKLG